MESFFVKVTEAHKRVSMLVPFPSYERNPRVENLNPNRRYFIQIMAFAEARIYTSENVSMTTDEGGNVSNHDGLLNRVAFYLKKEITNRREEEGFRMGECRSTV